MLLLHLHLPSEGDYSRILIFFQRFLKILFGKFVSNYGDFLLRKRVEFAQVQTTWRA